MIMPRAKSKTRDMVIAEKSAGLIIPEKAGTTSFYMAVGVIHQAMEAAYDAGRKQGVMDSVKELNALKTKPPVFNTMIFN